MVETKETPNIFADIDSELPEYELSKLFLKIILEKSVDVSDPLYKSSFQRIYKVNLKIFEQKGYQLYEPTKYSYKYGEFLDDPDFTFIFKDIEFIRERLQGDRSRTAWGRNSEDILQICRKEDLFTAYTKAKVGNAQLFLVKIPIFKDIVESIGASPASALPLRDEPDVPITPIKEGEIASLMKDMLAEAGNMPEEQYQRNFQGQPVKINWDIDGNIAYQHFAENGYMYEFGKHIEDADVTLKFPNRIHAKRFLLKIPANYAARIVDKKLNFYYKNPVISVIFKDKETSAVTLARFPFYRELNKSQTEIFFDENEEIKRENYGHYIPVDLPIGDFENVAVPYKVFEHFINKASNIILRTCPCRERWECENHSIELGCIFMGDDTKNMVLPPEQGYVATKEQALEHLTKAMAEGLVPLLGRNVAEAEGGHGVEDTGKFLSGCFCCECCCINATFARNGTAALKLFDRMEGLHVEVDPDICVGCGECLEICAFKGMEMINGKAVVNQNRCLGCGRCESTCPNGAISIYFEDINRVDEFINTLESHVDVS